MSIMIAGMPVPACKQAGGNPPSGAGGSTACQLGSVRVPGLMGKDSGHLPSGAAQPDLVRYVRILLARFAAHGRSPDPSRCRCGCPCPCMEEQQVARLLEVAGDACQ
jgi:hypothetical protein